MSRVGKKPIPLPKGVKVQIGDMLEVTGPKGKLMVPIANGVRVTELVAGRREQAGFRRNDFRPRVEEHEVAGAVRVLCFTRARADLSQSGRLLIAQRAADGYFIPEGSGPPRAAVGRGI